VGSQEWQGLMRKTVTRCGIAALALSSAVLISYPSFPSTFAIIANPQLVNHALKGDRLPTTAPGSSKSRATTQPSLERAEKQVPVGCDRAFSPVSSPRFATIFGRCVV
jgi:hypothetical protein